jgi:hypothetical protein
MPNGTCHSGFFAVVIIIAKVWYNLIWIKVGNSSQQKGFGLWWYSKMKRVILLALKKQII